MRKRRAREVKGLTQSHTECKWQSQDSNPDSLNLIRSALKMHM